MWQVGRHIVIKSYPSMSNHRGIEVPWKGYSDQKRIFCQLETQFPSAGWTEVDKINASRHIDIIQFISFITDNAHSIFSSGYVSALSRKDNKCTIQSQCKFTQISLVTVLQTQQHEKLDQEWFTHSRCRSRSYSVFSPSWQYLLNYTHAHFSTKNKYNRREHR